jgi:hypothetical protein
MQQNGAAQDAPHRSLMASGGGGSSGTSTHTHAAASSSTRTSASSSGNSRTHAEASGMRRDDHCHNTGSVVKHLRGLFAGDDAFDTEDAFDTDVGYMGKGRFLLMIEGLCGDRSMECAIVRVAIKFEFCPS